MVVLEFAPLVLIGLVIGVVLGLFLKRRPKVPTGTARFDVHSDLTPNRTIDLKSGDVIKFTGSKPVTLKCLHHSWFDVVVEDGEVEFPNANRVVEI